jgi:hypothetical protein
MSEIYAVLTGDLIGSRTQSDATETSMRVLAETCAAFGELYSLDLRFTRHRGDGWQVIVPANYFYDLTLTIAARLKATKGALPSKIGTGLGPITSRGTDSLSDASGSAFIASGEMLEFLSASSSTATISVAGPVPHQMHQAIIRITDWMIQGWTQPQAEAVAVYMQRHDLHTNKERATILGISRQAFEARVNSSGFPELADARNAFMHSEFEAAT